MVQERGPFIYLVLGYQGQKDPILRIQRVLSRELSETEFLFSIN